MNTLRRVAIIGGNRIPFARSNGPYASASNQAMLTAASTCMACGWARWRRERCSSTRGIST